MNFVIRETAMLPTLRLAAVLLVGLILAAGCTETGSRTDAKADGLKPPRMASDQPSQARFEAVVYAVEVPAGRMADLDAKAIEAKGAGAKDFEKALADLGKAKLLYKVDQPVNLAGDTITLGTQVPIVTSARAINTTDAVANTTQYQHVGAIFNIQRAAPASESPPNTVASRLSVEVSALTESDIEVGPGTKATRIVTAKFANAPIRFDRPVVAISLSDQNSAAKSAPIACVIRYVFTER
jgi:hypothetical protein